MDTIVNYVTTNWVEICATFVAVVYAGEKISALTATTADDKVFGWLHTVANWVALQKKPGA